MIFIKIIVIIIIEKLRKDIKKMASKAKHAQRSKRSYHTNSIPVGMFYRYADRVAQARFIRNMTKASAVAADAVTE